MIGTTEYYRLRRIARGLIRDERVCTLTATGLVHELLLKDLKLSDGPHLHSEPENIEPVPYASRVMKQILIDRARRRKVRKRSEDRASRGSSGQLSTATRFVVDLDDAINQLGVAMPEHAELVRLHLYAEMNLEAVADKLGMSRATAYRKWMFCKAWIASQIKNGS